MKLAYFPFYPDDYLSSPGVTTCDLVDEGIYLRLLAYSWKHEGCQLPDDIPYLRKLCKGVRVERLKAVLERHFERFELESGKFFWRNARLFAEFCKSLHKSDQARESIKYRWNKEKQDTDVLRTNNERNTIQNQNQNQNQNKSKDKVKSVVDESANPEKPRFVHPTLEQVAEYCRERQNKVDPQKWLDHYTSNGWKVGRNPMRDWKASVRTWEKNEHAATGGKKHESVSERLNREQAEQRQRVRALLGVSGKHDGSPDHVSRSTDQRLPAGRVDAETCGVPGVEVAQNGRIPDS